MRDQLALKPFGLSPLRSFTLFVTTLVVTMFAFLFATAPTAHAAPEATWKDGSIVYDGKTYGRDADVKANSSTGLPAGTKVYASFDPSELTGDNPRIYLITFPPNSDPTTLTSATFTNYKYTPPDSYTDPQGKTAITLTALSSDERGEQTTSCVVEGIGWIICPVTNFLTKAMDWLFGVMSSLLTVRPIQTDQESALYRGWAMMRNIANVAFVMAFLVVIYSQITSMGLTSYGIKRMLPRLIVAAILVNVSYWICAIAIDLSNIFGYSLYDMLNGMREGLTGSGTIGDEYTWQNLGTLILSGGTAAAGAGMAAFSAVAAAGGPIYMLIPILLGVIISALVALLVMVARQAIITILVIVAPLAFVAYLLPNTEKYFKKWTDLFSTMLLLFPMFSIVLGGAQLAGDAIIASARQGNGDFNLIILGMAVKVAPVVITPFLLKFSGSLMGRIAGVVNNPGKGLIDRTRNMAKERADQHTARALANKKNPGLVARSAQRIDAGRRKRAGWKQANEARADANWANSEAYAKIHGYGAQSSQIKEVGENAANTHVAQLRASNAAAQDLDLRARASKLTLDVSQAKVDANWEEVKAGNNRTVITAEGLAGSALNAHVRSRIGNTSEGSIDAAAEARRAHVAKETQNNTYAQAMIDREALQRHAGGIAGRVGADSALADAIVQKRKQYGDEVKAAGELIDHFNLDGQARQTLALGTGDVEAKNDAGQVVKVFKSDSSYMREAAIKAQLSGQGSYAQMEKIIELSGSDLKDYVTTISASIVSGKIADKAPFMGGKTIDIVSQGGIGNPEQLATAIAKSIAGGKLKAEHLVSMDQDALKSIVARVAGKSGADLGLTEAKDIANFEHYAHELGNLAHDALTDKRLSARLAGGAEGHLRELERLYPPGSAAPPLPPPDYTVS